MSTIKLTCLLLVLPAAWLASACTRTEIEEPRYIERLDAGWKFARGPHPGAEAFDFDDRSWQPVRLPHDWAIEGPYEPEGDPHTGKLPWRGEGWYRKTLTVSRADSNRRIYLDFDGVMANPTVFVNGEKAGGWDYGYMSFRVDATSHIRFGQENLIAVHVDTRNHNSRWYPGAGIYRKVRLVILDPVHLAHWGTYVTTQEVSEDLATVTVRTEIESHRDRVVTGELETVLVDPEGREAGRQRSDVSISPTGATEATQKYDVQDPVRWDVVSPRLYQVQQRLYVDDRWVDSVETAFGIRTFEFTADDGFHLNGRRVQLKGVNLHHDHGPLGAAFFLRAMERQLEIMQDMGVNAIRTSHNPPAPELLDLCDRMGLLVWDEAFDKWDATSTRPPETPIIEYNRRQIDSFVRRDRNHPSVVVWSIGNEIWDLERLELPDSPGLVRKMVDAVRELDPTRPVGLAHAVPESAASPLDDALDVTGWNYGRRYAISREKRPELPIIYSESASALSTRGHYELPHPSRKDDFSTSLRLSSYDHNSASWSDLADTEFALMEKDSFAAGEFVWTGFDYLGEPTPFISRGWGSFQKRKITPAQESRSSLFGIVDLAGIPKDRYFLYRSYWAPEKQTIHILPHWNWPDRVGQRVPVYVYTNGDSAELFLNGRSLGVRSKQPQAENVMDRYRLRWEDARYEPGEVRAVAYKNGQQLGEATVRTAEQPSQLRLVPDRVSLKADGQDLAYVTIQVVDRNGIPCPLAMDEVSLTVSGPATIAGVGNGDHHFPAEYDSDRVALFYGRAMAIIRADEGSGGQTQVEARADGLSTASVVLEVLSSP